MTSRNFGKYLEQYPENIRKIALALRVGILKIIPTAEEKVHIGMKWVAYGAPRAIFAIKPEQNHVKLFFFEGAKLSDPDHVLRGSGSRLRFIPVTNTEKEGKIIEGLMEQAYFLHKKEKN